MELVLPRSDETLTGVTPPDSPPHGAPAAPTQRSSQPGDDPIERKRQRRVIWLLVVSAFVLLLNETTMSVAIRPIMTDLGVDAVTGQWLATSFMLTMAVVIPVTGFLLQRFNTRPVYLAAMILFCTGTLLAGLAPFFPLLVAARVVQASGTAIMLPLLMTTLMTLVAPHERGKMMGNVSMVISVAPAIGPTISGVLLNTVGWRGVFFFMLPIGLAMLGYGARTITNVSDPKPVPVDVVSVLLSAIGFGGLVYGLSEIGGEGSAGGSGSAVMIGSLACGAAGLTLFVLRQVRLQRRDAALLDLRTFRHRQFSVGLGIMAAMMASLFGAVIVLPLYLQGVLNLEPVTVGLMLLPGGLLMGLLSQVVGRLYDRVGPRVLVAPATVLVGAVLLGFSRVSEHTAPGWIVVGHILLSLGLAFVFTPLFTSSLAAVPPSLYSHASALLGTLQQVAGAAGTAMFVTIMALRTSQLSDAGLAPLQAAAGGVRTAFVAGAVLALVPIALSFLLRTPAPVDDPAGSATSGPGTGVEPAADDALRAASHPVLSKDGIGAEAE